MPSYEYVGLDGLGKQVKGAIDGENVRAARQKLRSQGIFPTEVTEAAVASANKTADVKRYFESDRISTGTLSVTTRQLATLVGAGLPLVSALQALTDQTESLVLRRMIVQIREDVEQGTAFATSIGRFPKAFPRLYVNMVASGEASGTLDSVLNNLADYLDAQVELRRKIGSALTYPILMLIICSGVILGMFTFVIPKIVEIFEKQGAILPLPTRIMIWISFLTVNYWYVAVIAGVLGVIALRSYYRTVSGRSKIDRLLMRIPIYGPLSIKIATVRVAGTLSTLLSSGVGLLAGIDITKNIVSNVHLVEALTNARDGVREGRSFAKELSRSGYFPSMLSHMLAVGEQSGQLEQMLEKSAQAYEGEVNATLSGLTSLLEPLMMIFVGGIVLCIVVSVLLPMVDLISVMQGK